MSRRLAPIVTRIRDGGSGPKKCRDGWEWEWMGWGCSKFLPRAKSDFFGRGEGERWGLVVDSFDGKKHAPQYLSFSGDGTQLLTGIPVSAVSANEIRKGGRETV